MAVRTLKLKMPKQIPFMKHIFALSVAMLPVLGFAAGQGAHTLDIRADRMGAEIQPTMYGLFFEDINYGADGGLYAEMVKNRSFEFPQSLMGWQSFGKVDVKDQEIGRAHV